MFIKGLFVKVQGTLQLPEANLAEALSFLGLKELREKTVTRTRVCSHVEFAALRETVAFNQETQLALQRV